MISGLNAQTIVVVIILIFFCVKALILGTLLPLQLLAILLLARNFVCLILDLKFLVEFSPHLSEDRFLE